MARREHTQHNQIDKRKHASASAGRKEKPAESGRRNDHARAERSAAPKRGGQTPEWKRSGNSASDEGRRAGERAQSKRGGQTPEWKRGGNSASDEGRRAGERAQIKRAPMAFTASGTAARDWALPVAVAVETEAQLAEVLKHDAVALVYLDEACFTDFAALIRRVHAAGKKAGLRLRRIERDFDANGRKAENSAELLSGLWKAERLPDALLVRNLDEAMLLEDFFGAHPELGAHIRRNFDYTVYGYNQEAIQALVSLGADGLTYPIELTYHECRKLKSELPFELMIYGHLPMMVSANCIQRTSARCDHGNRILQLRDRMGKDMPVRCYCTYCYNQIFNAEPLVLYDLPDEVRALQPQCLRYDFSVEPAAVVRQVLDGAVPRSMTRGHFRHGIE